MHAAEIAPRVAGTQRVRRAVGGETAAHAYQDFVVGSRSWSRLLVQELVGAGLGPVPGAAGLLLRKQLWPLLFQSCGNGAIFGRNISLRHPRKMRLGAGVMVDDDCLLDAGGAADGGFCLEDGVLISRSTRLVAHGGGLWLGARVNVGADCSFFVGAGGLRVGADTMFAAHCYIGGGKYDVDQPIDVPMSQRPVRDIAPTVIEEDCWIGAGAVVLAGVTLGRGSVIGAGAVVTRDIPPYSIAVGQPARVQRRRKHAPEGAGTPRLQALPAR